MYLLLGGEISEITAFLEKPSLLWVIVPDVKYPPKEGRESGNKTKSNSEQS